MTRSVPDIAGLWASCAQLGFALDVTSGRARAMIIAGVGLISLIIGGLALARSGSGRGTAIVALVLGLIGVVLSADRKSTRLNSSHSQISYAVFCLKKKTYSNHLALTLFSTLALSP